MVVTEIQKNPATVLRKETEDQQEDQTNQSMQLNMKTSCLPALIMQTKNNLEIFY